MTIPDDWVCYATRCYKPMPPGTGEAILIVGLTIGVTIGLIIVGIVFLATRNK